MANNTFLTAEDYVYASTRVRLYEKRLLSASQKAQFLSAKSYEEALRLLAESPYGNRMDGDKMSYWESLAEETRRLDRELEEVAAASPLLRMLVLPNIFHNLKVLFKIYILDQDLEDLLVPVRGFDVKYIESLIRLPETNQKETIEEKAVDLALQDFAKYKDPERVEILLDKAMFGEMQKIAAELNSDLIADWLRQQIDLQNLATYLRMKNLGENPVWFDFAFIPGATLTKSEVLAQFTRVDLPGQEELKNWGLDADVQKAFLETLEREDVAYIEKRKDELSLEFAERAKRITYGPEVLFSYYLRRQLEIQNLRTLLVALKSHLSQEEIAKRLRH